MKQVVALFPLLIAGLLDATPANAELSAPVMALAALLNKSDFG
ncbi:hypothetical protein [Klebsiella pneumoniae]|nr:hypothetical protein [Klebsiella pneumoniae]